MMATTHGYAGLALVVPLAVLVPELALPAAVGAIAGGIFPDFDVAFEHRRTLHFPVYYGVLTVPAVLAALLWPAPLTVGVAAFTAAAWIHSASDALGGGPELDPWRNPCDEGVYDHARQRWLTARRYVRYDGSPEDFLLGGMLAIPALLVFDGAVQALVLAGLIVSLGYTIVRRRIPDWVPEQLQ